MSRRCLRDPQTAFLYAILREKGGVPMAERVADTVVKPSEVIINEHRLFGRTKILLDYDFIDASNIEEALGKVLNVHLKNAAEIEYLWRYYKGDQPILNRTKNVRPEINNKIVVNIANEIVSFKVGYQVGEPVMYVSKKNDQSVMDALLKLNDFMFSEDKAAQDQEVVEWQIVCGTAYRMVLPDSTGEEDESPFEMYTLDPRNTFVAYSTGLGNKPILAGTRYKRNGHEEWTLYTDSFYFVFRDGKLAKYDRHAYWMIPIFEYPANHARLGAFEIVLPLLDEMNNINSNRMDGIEQEVQAFIKFINCDIDENQFKALKEMGAIKVKSVQGQTADVDVVKSELNQDQTQTLVNDIYQRILTICGMPNRNGGTSTSDTGNAVIFRDGWETAESRAKDFEHMFKRSEKQMLRMVLRIISELAGVELKLSDIDMKFTRRNYENIQSKAQVLTTMLGNPKIHPRLAFEHCGMFSDAESAFTESEKYYEEVLKRLEPENDPDDNPDKQKAGNDQNTGDQGGEDE